MSSETVEENLGLQGYFHFTLSDMNLMKNGTGLDYGKCWIHRSWATIYEINQLQF